MNYNLNDRALLPDSLMACQMSAEEESAARSCIEKMAHDEDDRRYLLAVWLGDPLD